MTRLVEDGDAREEVPPSPTWPEEPSPQHMTRRSPVESLEYRAHVVPPPEPELVDTETSSGVHPATVVTLTGSSEVTAPAPLPSCPSVATPQQITLLDETAHPCVSPTSKDESPLTPDPIEVPVGWSCEFPMTVGDWCPARENTRSSLSSSK